MVSKHLLSGMILQFLETFSRSGNWNETPPFNLPRIIRDIIKKLVSLIKELMKFWFLRGIREEVGIGFPKAN